MPNVHPCSFSHLLSSSLVTLINLAYLLNYVSEFAPTLKHRASNLWAKNREQTTTLSGHRAKPRISKRFDNQTMYFTVTVNTTRGGIKGHPDEAFRRAEARKHVRLFLAPKDAGQMIWDSMIPDYLVTDSMVDRFLAIDPPE